MHYKELSKCKELGLKLGHDYFITNLTDKWTFIECSLDLLSREYKFYFSCYAINAQYSATETQVKNGILHAVKTHTGAIPANQSANIVGPDMSISPVSPYQPILITPEDFAQAARLLDSEQLILPYNSPQTAITPKCECGSTAVGSSKHSTWCPMVHLQEIE